MPEVTPKLSQQHPVPQHIAAFEFKLIGDLTVKQFLFAGVGVAVAYAAYISELNFILKWLLIITSATLGLGTAFLPIQDRTMDQWILNFIRAVLSPTQRIWRKEPLPPEYLREDYAQFLTSQVLSLTPRQSRQKLAAYLEAAEGGMSQLDLAEDAFVQRLNFEIPTTIKDGVQKARIEPARPPTIAPPSEVAGVIEVKAPEKRRGVLPQIIEETKKDFGRLAELEKRNLELQEKLKTAEALLKTPQPPLPAKPEPPPRREPPSEPPREKGVPNIIRGLVRDSRQRFLEGAVVIVKDEGGDPVRALKTNRLGQFTVSTPLENGAYTVEISAQGRQFDIIKITADGSVLPPLEFRERYAGS